MHKKKAPLLIEPPQIVWAVLSEGGLLYPRRKE